MKKLAIVAGLLIVKLVSFSMAESLGERLAAVGNTFNSTPQFTLLENAYVLAGRQFTHSNCFRGGVITRAYTWGIFSADGGYVTPDFAQAASRTGSALWGVSVIADKLVNAFAPEITGAIQGLAWDGAKPFIGHLNIGIGAYNDTANEVSANNLEVMGYVAYSF